MTPYDRRAKNELKALIAARGLHDADTSSQESMITALVDADRREAFTEEPSAMTPDWKQVAAILADALRGCQVPSDWPMAWPDGTSEGTEWVDEALSVYEKALSSNEGQQDFDNAYRPKNPTLLSNGYPATLGGYRDLTVSSFGADNYAVRYFDMQIAEKGRDEPVTATTERQMLELIIKMVFG